MLMGDTSLSLTKDLTVRFSEVDAMGIVWHGSYALYFEDAREAFGARYGLDYLTILRQGYYTPLVDLEFHYRHPLIYGAKPAITITHVPAAAAKIIFDYVIRDADSGVLCATGRSVQVFLDKERRLVWSTPRFYAEWKRRWRIE